MPLLYCPTTSAEPIHIGAGDSASQGNRFDLLQDVADQIRHRLTSEARPLSGRWLQLEVLVTLVFHLPMKNHRMNIQETLSQLTHIYVGSAMLFNHLSYNVIVWIGTRVSIFLMAVTDVLPGILEVSLGRFLPHKSPGN